MTQFTPEERALLEQYVTDVDGDVYAIKNLQGIVGAVYARYSRAKTSFRETLLKEFVEAGKIDPEHAEELIERVLIAYGDDSVGELEGAHLSFENISMIATKEIEDRRIGGSPIEKSTRYVFFDQKDERDEYLYMTPQEIMASPFANEYTQAMDFIFDTYTRLVKPMQKYYKQRYPLDKVEYDILGTGTKQKYAHVSDDTDKKAFERTYRMDIRTKACDTLRCLLPLSTKTNVGLFGNGRFWQMLISHLISSDYIETQSLGKLAFRELSKIIPKYVRRAKQKEYNMAIREDMRDLARMLFQDVQVDDHVKPVVLVPLAWRNTEDYLLAHMVYEYVEHPFEQVYELIKRMSAETKEQIKATYVGNRQKRRDRPGRAFESGYTYTVDLVADWGTYKDLMRHRINTQLRQTFSPMHGMIIPDDLVDAGFADAALACHEKVVGLYKKLVPEVGSAASYVTLHGSKVRWLMGFNDREAQHMLELRTTPQGHPQYRKLCQQIHTAIKERDPWRAEVMQFVDHNNYESARGDSEAKQRVKEQLLDKKYNV